MILSKKLLALPANNWTRLERLAQDKQSNLLGPFVSYKENEVLLIRPQNFNNLKTFETTPGKTGCLLN
jgi:hypothetical protein